MTAARLARMFHDTGTCLDVAIDHGLTNEFDLLTGIESMPKAVSSVLSARPDAIQLPPGAIRYLDASQHQTPLVVRTDVSNVYGTTLPRETFSTLMNAALSTAVREDAVCVVVNLLELPDEPKLHDQCVRNIALLRGQCDEVGMPLMVEPLVMALGQSQGYLVDGDLRKIVPLVRQAVELGADIVKTDPCDDLTEYHQVIETAGSIPVLVRGGGRASDRDILTRTETVMQQGACGVVYGRNILQHPTPAVMIEALLHIVRGNMSADQAHEILEHTNPAQQH